MYSLSVIIPVYNAEKYLTRTLESVSAQTIANSMQIILIDDGSADASPAICDEFASRHHDTVVIHRKNGGVSAARNAGLKEASGEYVGFVDADDTVAPDYFEKLLNAAKKNNCDMAFSSITFLYNDDVRPCPDWYPQGTLLNEKELKENFARKMLSDGSQNSVCLKIFRHLLIKEFSLEFPTNLKIGEDKRFVLDYLCHCTSAVCAGNCGYYYLNVELSAMHSDKKMVELLAADEYESEIFVSLGLNKKTVREEKSAFLFYELADFLQRCFSRSCNEAKISTKLHFGNQELMTKIDYATNFIKANNGTIYTLLATAFARRSVLMTLAVLWLQKKIQKGS